MNETEWRCALCREEFETAVLESVAECPSCGTRVAPQLLVNDVVLSINWQDLRCLFNWAAVYIDSAKLPTADVDVYFEKLLDRIRQHRPDGAPALTMQDEIDEAREKGLNVQVTFVNASEYEPEGDDDDSYYTTAYPLM